LSKHTKKQLI